MNYSYFDTNIYYIVFVLFPTLNSFYIRTKDHLYFRTSYVTRRGEIRKIWVWVYLLLYGHKHKILMHLLLKIYCYCKYQGLSENKTINFVENAPRAINICYDGYYCQYAFFWRVKIPQITRIDRASPASWFSVFKSQMLIG